jgi:hypothetical protein
VCRQAPVWSHPDTDSAGRGGPVLPCVWSTPSRIAVASCRAIVVSASRRAHAGHTGCGRYRRTGCVHWAHGPLVCYWVRSAVKPMKPFEFVIPSRPVSAQARRAKRRGDWQNDVRNWAIAAWTSEHALASGNVAVELVYFILKQRSTSTTSRSRFSMPSLGWPTKTTLR